MRTLRTASAQGNLSGPDADLDAEPEELMCPITRTVFRDPVMVVESGHTYERSAILEHFRRNGAKDPLTNCALSSAYVMTNWAMRNVVQAWLDKHPGVTPDDGTRTFDDEGDVGVLRTWRAMCPELQERWPEDARPEHWEGVTMENGRVVKLRLADMGLGGAVPAVIGQLTSLKMLSFWNNQLTSVPAEIGQLTSLTHLTLGFNQLTSVPAEIGQLTSLTRLNLAANPLTSVPAEIGQLTSLEELYLIGNQLTSLPAEIGQLTSLRVVPRRQSADEPTGGDRAAHVAEGIAPRSANERLQSANEHVGCDTRAHSGGLPRASGSWRDVRVETALVCAIVACNM